MDSIDDIVVSELRRRRVKLWLPPYLEGGEPNEGALIQLARGWAREGSGCALSGQPADGVLRSLRAFQSRAVVKLVSKRKGKAAPAAIAACGGGETHPDLPTSAASASPSAAGETSAGGIALLEVRIVGPWEARGSLSPPDGWAERVEFEGRALILHGVSQRLSAGRFREDLKCYLGASRVRLVHKGKTVPCGGEHLLVEVLLQQRKEAGDEGPKAVMICLVSQAGDKPTADPTKSPDQSLIDSIRLAAGRLRDGARFEITDQGGRNVPMSASDRAAFLTALGLHRIGRRRMEEAGGGAGGGDDGHGRLTSALSFLLEADAEWGRPGLLPWRERADNYGLLQLDVAWAHLRLESLSALPDAMRRLEAAERALRKQFHANFVTLALVHAEAESGPVPPLAAVFARLFLLQGVGYRHCGGVTARTKSEERLGWAFSLCRALRRSAPEESVRSLCEAMGVAESAAVSALRRAGGNADAAAELVAQDERAANQEGERRERQRVLGLCANGMDHVELNLIPQLQGVLGLEPAAAPDGTTARPFQGRVPPEDANAMVAAGLLRLADNDLGRAIDVYQEAGRSRAEVLGRVSALDRQQGRKRGREDEGPVDGVALATLVSMGVEEGRARGALSRSGGSVDLALLRLTGSSAEEASGAPSGAASGGGASEGEPPSGEGSGGASGTCGGASGLGGSSGGDRTSASERRRAEEAERRRAERRRREEEEREARELLERELGQVLQERDLEKEYLGSSLNDEWHFITKYRSQG